MRRARALAPDEAHALAAARLHAAHRLMPYLAGALFRLRPFAVDDLGTVAVDDRWRLLIDPVVTAGWGVRATAGVLLHEVGHALRDHAAAAAREGPLVDRHAFNLCADAAINDDLVAAGVPLPGAPVLPTHLRDRAGRSMPVGWTAQRYYAELPRRTAPVPHDDGATDGAGDGLERDRGDGRDGAASARDGRAPGTTPDGATSADGDGSPVVVEGRAGRSADSCGAVAGGADHDVVVPREALADGDEGDGGLSAVEQRLARRAVASAIARTATRGEVPAGLRRWADDELAPPTVPWQQVLRAAVRRATADTAGVFDTTYARPSRRRVPGVVLPGTRRPEPRVAVVLDTSASMDDQLLGEALAEVEAIVRATGGRRASVVTVDAAVHTTRLVGGAHDVDLRGGGGTDLTPGLEHAVRGRAPADVVVVLTDGHTPWPDLAPRRATAWVVGLVGGASPTDDPATTGPGGRRPPAAPPPPPDWARVVHVGPADRPARWAVAR